MNRKYLVAITLMMILVISLQSVIGIAIAKKPEKPPEPEFPIVDFDIHIGLIDEDLILLKETKYGLEDYFHVPVSLEDYSPEDISDDERHRWAHFDGGYGAEPIALGIYDVANTDLADCIEDSTERYNYVDDGQEFDRGVIQMLWLWHQWGVGIKDGLDYNYWRIGFCWYTVKETDRQIMMFMKAKTYDGFTYNSDNEVWTIIFDEYFTLEYIEIVKQSRGKSGKVQWITVDQDIAWEGNLKFTVTLEKVSASS